MIARQALTMFFVTVAAGSPSSVLAKHPGRGSSDQMIDGSWRFTYSCADATGMYAQRCAAGERDNFSFSILHNGDQICGSYELTAQMGNHVDDGDLSEWTFTRADSNRFRVHFAVSGSVGEATVILNGDKLLWTVTKQCSETVSPWSFSPPDKAVLVRKKADRGFCD